MALRRSASSFEPPLHNLHKPPSFLAWYPSYVVTGGSAVDLHGHTRPLAYLDIVVVPRPDEQNRVLQVLMLAGFVSHHPGGSEYARVLQMFNQSEREIDVFVRFHSPFDELWAESVQISVGEGVMRLISLAHLLRAKRIISRWRVSGRFGAGHRGYAAFRP